MRPILTPLLPALTLLVTLPLTAQGNAKVMFNATHATGAVRGTTTEADTLYFIQPEEWRVGHGSASGLHVTLKDSDQSTAESVTLGFVAVASEKPVPTQVLGSVQANLFGSGSGEATMTFRVTFATPLVLPARSGQLLGLPIPRAWPGDALTVAYQDGTEVKSPYSVGRVQWTFRRAGNSAWNWLSIGSVIDLGGLYDEPVVGPYIASTAYGSLETIDGPEALYPTSARGDGIGYWCRMAAFANEWALVVLSTGKAAAPVGTPFGPILIDPTAFVPLPLPIKLDANGFARTGTVPVPPALKATFWAQGAGLNLTTNTVRVSDAHAMMTQFSSSP